ncbi:ssDNA-binding protein [Gordonia phage Clawz]|uniref:Single-stranded DNA-binding protein n=1 Tax=Gordonia phage Clawz TaxID=2743910 RepID=A0AAE7K687_9CAUD|nr:ssDNA-binding protein [Gordonia phage Clawz]QKY80000.1 ssDNA-binding protein [Gordonia phage Clawz]
MTIDSTITIVGNLTADPSLRFDPQGQPQVKFSVAVTRRRYDRHKQDWVDADTTFIVCELWGAPAENVASSLHKGQRVIVSGKLQTKRWTTKNNENRERMELRVDDIGPSLKYGRTTFQKSEYRGPYRDDPTPGSNDAPF